VAGFGHGILPSNECLVPCLGGALSVEDPGDGETLLEVAVFGSLT
jgi:hypothetical protein